MFEKEFNIAQLITARVNGTITAEQQMDLDAWVNASERNARQYDKYIDEEALGTKIKTYYQVDSAALYQKINEGIRKSKNNEPNTPAPIITDHANSEKTVAGPKAMRLWTKIGIAAAIAIMVSGAALFINRTSGGFSDEINYTSDALPGKEGATLTLANGKKIRLSDVASGELAKEAGVTISKTADGELIYTIEGRGDSNSFNTLSTARGETYQVKLPDGSRVWLNAASSLTYPTSLSKDAIRAVKLSGEAYFEIQKDAARPFVVETAGQKVEVLGTHFNINSYDDEPAVATTLLEGSIKVQPIGTRTDADNSATERILAPGQQALIKSGALQVRKVDAENVTDWQGTAFNLEGVQFEALMRKISRWYDVEVIYQAGAKKDVSIGGWISRDKKLSQVLRFIESSGAVHFNIENRKVVVIK